MNKQNNVLEIDVNTSDIILTPFICASLVNEILKCIIYQKSQIPYPYSWLKTVVNKRRNKQENGESAKAPNFKLDNHFRSVSSLYDNMEVIMESINKEFSSESSEVKEIFVVFGVTPFCPKEAFSIRIENISRGHLERNHHSDASKQQQKILRHIFLSQAWMDSIDSTMNCTNVYIFLRKDVLQNDLVVSTEGCFMPAKPPHLNDNIKRTIINFNGKNEPHECCDFLTVFGDTASAALDVNESGNFVEVWCQCKVLLKGFKDCFVNKVSLSELW